MTTTNLATPLFTKSSQSSDFSRRRTQRRRTLLLTMKLRRAIRRKKKAMLLTSLVSDWLPTEIWCSQCFGSLLFSQLLCSQPCPTIQVNYLVITWLKPVSRPSGPSGLSATPHLNANSSQLNFRTSHLLHAPTDLFPRSTMLVSSQHQAIFRHLALKLLLTRPHVLLWLVFQLHS